MYTKSTQSECTWTCVLWTCVCMELGMTALSSSQDGRSSSAGSETALIAGLAIGFAAVVVGLLLVGYKFAPCMNNNSGQNTELAGVRWFLSDDF